MSGSGTKAILINSRERAISPDANRAQALDAAQMAEVTRWLSTVLTSKDVGANGSELVPATITSPLGALILNGIRPQPVNATVNMIVSAGMMCAIFPETPAIADDSPAKLIKTAGVQVLGVLALTPNGAGATRIDIIECRPKFQTFETDNRDVFDPSTGLFAAVTVDKVRGYELEYRIRVGTAGAGFPGTALGWLPLAVASVPNGAVTWDTVILWDVRPLAADRASQPMSIDNGPLHMEKNQIFSDALSAPPAVLISGIVNAKSFFDNAGGPFAAFDINSVNAREPGFVYTNGTLWNLYLLEPFGLPRWVLYNAPAALRVPTFNRGIPVVSNKPADINGFPSALVSFPAVYGFAAATSGGICALSGVIAGGLITPAQSSGRRVHFTSIITGGAAVSTTNLRTRHTIAAGTLFPAHAKKFRLLMQVTVTIFVPGAQGTLLQDIAIWDAAFANLFLFIPGPSSYCTGPLGAGFTYQLVADIPVILPGVTMGIEWTYQSVANFLVNAPVLTVSDYEVFP